jgi:hypothetical protein
MAFVFDKLDSVTIAGFDRRGKSLYYPVPWRTNDVIGSGERKCFFDKERQIYLFDCGSPTSQSYLMSRSFMRSGYINAKSAHTFALLWRELLGDDMAVMEVSFVWGEPSGWDTYFRIRNFVLPEQHSRHKQRVCDVVNEIFQTHSSGSEVSVIFEESGIKYKNK